MEIPTTTVATKTPGFRRGDRRRGGRSRPDDRKRPGPGAKLPQSSNNNISLGRDKRYVHER